MQSILELMCKYYILKTAVLCTIIKIDYIKVVGYWCDSYTLSSAKYFVIYVIPYIV